MIDDIKKIYTNTPDLVIKEINIDKKRKIVVVFIETVSSSDRVNEYVLKGISNYVLNKNKNEKIIYFIPSPKNILINKDEIPYYLNNSFTIIFSNFDADIIAVETKADLDRNIEKSDVEANIVGPKDSFTENYQKNIGLIKKRIKDSSLKLEEFNIGNKTNTKLGLLYMDDRCNTDLLNKIKCKLKTIDLDFVIETENVRNFLIETNTLFPILKISERPDIITKGLIQGKYALICDNSPDSILMPSFIMEFINPIGDDYSKPRNVIVIKTLRIICLMISLFLPAIYIGLINYNPESIPTTLLINFAIQMNGIPFPAIFEAFCILFSCEILKESDIRFPSSYGSSVSILGALILGEAAVSAGLVSPIMIIVIAMTYISNLIFSDLNFKNAIRIWSYIILIFSSILGLFGVACGIILFAIHLSSINFYGYSYIYPIIPFNKDRFINEVIEKNEAKQ